MKIEGHPTLEKDPSSNAVLSKDKSAHQAFMVQHSARIAQAEKIKFLEEKLENVDDKLEKILKLLGTEK